MPSTTNFSWTTPADTDYVKDGASAIRTLANGIDTSMAQLKGGTTGQILSKTNGTDMAFTWINNDQGDITGVTAGTGLSGGGTSGSVTLSIDTATTVDKTTAQTLTNKTISATSNTLTGVINNTLTTTTGDLIYASSANTPARLAIGSTGQVLTVSSGVPTWATASSSNSITYATFVDQKTSGTDGGTATGGAWATRTLNTTVNNSITSCSLSSNQISLPAGTYKVFAGTPGQQIGTFQCRLYNVTDSSVAVLGLNAKQDSSNDTTAMAILTGNFTITGTKTFELQMYPQSTKNQNGFGSQTGNGSSERYSFISIEKVG